MAEQWAKIDGYPKFLVSNWGRVRVDGSKRLLSRYKDRDGNLCVTFKFGNETTTRLVRQLVAQAFLEPDPDPAKNLVGCKDGDRNNCAVNNLYWESRAEVSKRFWKAKKLRIHNKLLDISGT